MIILIFYCSLMFQLSHSNVRLVCPRPLSAKSHIVLRSTSNDESSIHQKCLSSANSNTVDVMEIQPGLFTIRFEETTFLAGTPFRVLLTSDLVHHETINESETPISRPQRDIATNQSIENNSNFNNSQIEPGINDDDLDSLSNVSSESFGNNSTSVHSSTPVLDVNLENSTNDSDTEKQVFENTTRGEEGFPETSTFAVAILISNETLEMNATQRGNVDNSTTREEQGNEAGKESEGEGMIQTCLLLDHIPHNDHAVIKKECSREANNYPLGKCTESNYYITVRIPDVTCQNCLLVVQQVETDPDHEVCNLTQDGRSSNCTSYISCAKVTIRPTADGQNRNLSHCSDYLDNLPGDWPYRAQDVYVTEEHAVLTMDLKHRDLHIEAPQESKVGPVEKIEIRIKSAVIWSTSVAGSHNSDDSKIISTVWRQVPSKFLTALKANQFILNVIGSRQSQATEVLYKDQHFQTGHMTALYDIYSPSGWLVAPKFIGSLTEDSMAAMPVGDCAPPARHFMSFFEAAEGGNYGLLGMTILENRAYLTSVLHVQLGKVLSIKLIGSELVGAKSIEIPVPANSSGVFQTAIDITNQEQYMDTVQFLKSVEVKTDRDNAAMIGDLEEGFYSILMDDGGHIKGLGAFQLTQGDWMRVEIVAVEKPYLSRNDVNQNDEDVSPMPERTSAEIVTSYGQLLDLSKEAIFCQEQFCCMEGYVHELSSELLLHLFNGEATLRVVGDKGSITGKILGPNSYKQSSGFYQTSQNLSSNTAFTKTKGGMIKAVVFPNRAQVLELSIQVNDVPQDWMKKPYSAKIIIDQNPIATIPLKFSSLSSTSYVAKAKYPLAEANDLGAQLSQPESVIRMKVTNDAHSLLDGALPPIEKKMCVSSKTHVVGKRKSLWSPKSAPLEDVHAVVSDYIKFVFDNSTSLYLMDSMESYKNCDFSNAQKLEILNKVKDMSLHFFVLKEAGIFYFADKESCQSGSPAKVTVHAIGARDNIVKDGEHGKWCRVSFYAAWRQSTLDQWEGPSMSGSVMLGLGLGMLIGFVFLLWQGIRMKHSGPHAASGRRSSLSHFVRF